MVVNFLFPNLIFFDETNRNSVNSCAKYYGKRENVTSIIIMRNLYSKNHTIHQYEKDSKVERVIQCFIVEIGLYCMMRILLHRKFQYLKSTRLNGSRVITTAKLSGH